MTANEAAREVFNEVRASGRTRVSNVEVHEKVAKKTGQSRKVISGTLDGTGGQTLVASDWYLNSWYGTKSVGRKYHNISTGKTGAVIQRENNYDFPEKRKAVKQVMDFLPTTGRPRLLTFAGISGNCVQAAVKRNSRVQVENIEKDPRNLELWQLAKSKLGVESTDHCCTFKKFVQTPAFQTQHYDLIFADMMGYMSKSLYFTLSIIDECKNADIFVLTTQRLEEFRNNDDPGTFQNYIRRLYASVEDHHVQSIVDCLSNYQFFESFEYQKDVGTIPMEVLLFKLDPDNNVLDSKARKKLLKLSGRKI
jgi:hypothetical protein